MCSRTGASSERPVAGGQSAAPGQAGDTGTESAAARAGDGPHASQRRGKSSPKDRCDGATPKDCSMAGALSPMTGGKAAGRDERGRVGRRRQGRRNRRAARGVCGTGAGPTSGGMHRGRPRGVGGTCGSRRKWRRRRAARSKAKAGGPRHLEEDRHCRRGDGPARRASGRRPLQGGTQRGAAPRRTRS